MWLSSKKNYVFEVNLGLLSHASFPYWVQLEFFKKGRKIPRVSGLVNSLKANKDRPSELYSGLPRTIPASDTQWRRHLPGLGRGRACFSYVCRVGIQDRGLN